MKKSAVGVLDELRTLGVNVEAFLDEALRAEQRVRVYCGDDPGRSVRSLLPILCAVGLLASPSVIRELLLLLDGSDTRALRLSADAIAGRSSAEIPAFIKAPAPVVFTTVSLTPISAAAELHARRVLSR